LPYLFIYLILSWGTVAGKFATGNWTAEEATQINVISTKTKNQIGE
jgi:hypothetical protein